MVLKYCNTDFFDTPEMLNIIPHLLIGPIETFLRQILSVLMMLLMLVLVIEIQ